MCHPLYSLYQFILERDIVSLWYRIQEDIQQGKALSLALKQANVPHVINSALFFLLFLPPQQEITPSSSSSSFLPPQMESSS